MSNTELAKTLDLEEYNDEPRETTATLVPPDSDFEFARQNIKDTIETSINAIQDLSSVAAQSQHPRAYEVLANLAKTIVDANEKLLDIHKHNPKGLMDKKTSNVTNNNLFVGSTAELQKMLTGLSREEKLAITKQSDE